MRAYRGSLVIGFIAVLIMATFIPGINSLNVPEMRMKYMKYNTPEATNESLTDEKREMIGVGIDYYKPDGSVEKKMVMMDHRKINNLTNKLNNTKTINEKFLLFKKYGFIPGETELSDWVDGMHKKAEAMGIPPTTIMVHTPDDENANNRGGQNLVFNLFCSVQGGVMNSFSLHVGPSLITGLIAGFLSEILNREIWLPTVDLSDTSIGLAGGLDTDGILGQYYNVGGGCFISLLGFVGVNYHIPFLFDSYLGYAVMAIGLVIFLVP